MFDPSKIPGMIEPVEQQMLTELAADPFVAEQGAIVEFGSFFGRSTSCLVNGAQQWWAPERGPVVFTFDSFACADGHGFAQHVRSFAKSGGVGALIRIEGGKVNFRPAYDHFVGAAETLGVLKSTSSELRDSHPDGPIALMHIDSPKYYEEMKYILFRFFPALVPGAFVVFQDFLYHWSATLIAATQILTERGFLELQRTAASAVMGRMLRVPTPSEILDLDLAMTQAPVAELIDRSIARMKEIQVDRPEQFVPRLHLAKMQYLWEQGKFGEAENALLAMLKATDGGLSAPVFADLRELLRNGFSVRKAYELDH